MANVIDLRAFSDDSFVIHFGGPQTGINATTFAHSLMGLAEALRGINREINPGYDLDIVIEAVGPGSFRAKLRAVKRSAGNLFSAQGVAGIVLLGVLTNLIYDRLFPSPPPIIIIQTDAVIIDYNGTKIVVTKEAMEAKKKVEKNTTVNRRLAEAVQALEQDPKITSFGFTKRLDDAKPAIDIPRVLFPMIITNSLPPDNVNDQTVDVDAELTVVKAIIQRTSRKWEFYWNGIPISAPIRDDEFFDRLISRQISLSHGDTSKRSCESARCETRRRGPGSIRATRL